MDTVILLLILGLGLTIAGIVGLALNIGTEKPKNPDAIQWFMPGWDDDDDDVMFCGYAGWC
jgi:hypothetical protein